MRRYLSWLISVASALVFAGIAALYPQYFMYVIWGWFGVFIVGMVVFSAVTIKRGMSATAVIRRGRPIVKLDDKELAKVKEKDKVLQQEMSAIAKSSFKYMMTMLIMLIPIAFIYPTVLPALTGLLSSSLGEVLARFISYLTLFLIIMAAFRAIAKPPSMTMPVIPSKSFEVYEGGIVVDEMQGLRAPIEAKSVVVNTSRKFVELELEKGSVRRLRVYSKDPEKLWSVLSKLVNAKEIRSAE